MSAEPECQSVLCEASRAAQFLSFCFARTACATEVFICTYGLLLLCHFTRESHTHSLMRASSHGHASQLPPGERQGQFRRIGSSWAEARSSYPRGGSKDYPSLPLPKPAFDTASLLARLRQAESKAQGQPPPQTKQCTPQKRRHQTQSPMKGRE